MKTEGKKYHFETIESYPPRRKKSKMFKKEWFWMSKQNKNHCHYSGLPSPMAYESKKNKITVMKKSILKWYPIIIAFICLLYSVGLGLYGNTTEAMYSAHWPGTILLFSIAINQIKRQ
jgi:hypothetical protein